MCFYSWCSESLCLLSFSLSLCSGYWQILQGVPVSTSSAQLLNHFEHECQIAHLRALKHKTTTGAEVVNYASVGANTCKWWEFNGKASEWIWQKLIWEPCIEQYKDYFGGQHTAIWWQTLPCALPHGLLALLLFLWQTREWFSASEWNVPTLDNTHHFLGDSAPASPKADYIITHSPQKMGWGRPVPMCEKEKQNLCES